MVLFNDVHQWDTGFVLWTLFLCFTTRFIGRWVSLSPILKISTNEGVNDSTDEWLNSRSCFVDCRRQPIPTETDWFAGTIHYGIRWIARRSQFLVSRDVRAKCCPPASNVCNHHVGRYHLHRFRAGHPYTPSKWSHTAVSLVSFVEDRPFQKLIKLKYYHQNTPNELSNKHDWIKKAEKVRIDKIVRWT